MKPATDISGTQRMNSDHFEDTLSLCLPNTLLGSNKILMKRQLYVKFAMFGFDDSFFLSHLTHQARELCSQVPEYFPCSVLLDKDTFSSWQFLGMPMQRYYIFRNE